MCHRANAKAASEITAATVKLMPERKAGCLQNAPKYTFMACIGMVYIVGKYIVMTFIVTTYIVMPPNRNFRDRMQRSEIKIVPPSATVLWP